MFMRITIVAVLLSLSTVANAQQLQRRAFLGVQVAPLTEAQKQVTDHGVNIVRVFDDSTASRFGLEPQQIILQANGEELGQPGDLPAALHGLKSGAQIKFQLLVDGERVIRELELQEFPAEEVAGATLRYGSIATSNGLQRTILTLPTAVENPAVVYVLPGFGCASMDMALNPDDSITALLDVLTRNDYATFRVEKSGLGDSEGTPCSETGFVSESAGFARGLQELISTPEIDRQKIFLLGISLGGIWAPILASEVDIAGIISFSTISKTWPEYMYDNWRRQWELAGKSFASIDSDLKLASTFWDKLLTENLTPGEIFDRYPQLASLAGPLAYNPENSNILSRHYTFVKELANTNIASYWEQVNVPTLLLWGRGDYVATEEDQRLIDRLLQSRSVRSELVVIESDHFWREAGDFRTAYDNARQGVTAPLQVDIFGTIADWLNGFG